jgi:murein DD-endopeptidase MepM/ murein hydrolase activator NlpD
MSGKYPIAKRIGVGLLLVILIGYFIPERLVVPVDGATVSDWNESTFWYEPWGASGVHKGIDIFAPTGTNALAAVGGIVVFQGSINRGGNIILVLGPKWRLHYYAHMESSATSFGDFVSRGQSIGLVGDSGNASGKQSHLHYVILSVIPYPWLVDTETQGWKKMFYLDPNTKLRAALGI